MDTGVGWVISLAQAAGCDERWIGGKAARVARLARAGFRVHDGFVITTRSYEQSVEGQNLTRMTRIERRGGMLIHGAIIARKMAIPCVNGIAHVVDRLEEGEIVTMDGCLEIVPSMRRSSIWRRRRLAPEARRHKWPVEESQHGRAG